MFLKVGSASQPYHNHLGPTSDPLNQNCLGAGPGDLQLRHPLSDHGHYKSVHCSDPFPSHLHLSICLRQQGQVPQIHLSLSCLLCEAEAGRGSITSQHCGQPVTPVTLTSITADECFSDRNRREIPVAMGLSIAGLLGVLLTACLVTRKRPRRGYERM